MSFALPSQLLNPLVSSSSLTVSASELDNVPKHLEDSVRFETGRLAQAAGILLHLPQWIVAQAIVIMSRFWTGPEGGSLLDHDPKDVAAACLYLTAKPSTHPISARKVATTFALLTALPSNLWSETKDDRLQDQVWHLTEGDYQIARDRLYHIEADVLRNLGFQTHVALPHPLCINYLQTMDILPSEAGTVLAKMALRLLNGALLSPQLVYLTHQPSAIATAAIYLAAKETQVKLPDADWWEIFDVDREELGFLVVALNSLEAFALSEQERWKERTVPLTVEGVRNEIHRLQAQEP